MMNLYEESVVWKREFLHQRKLTRQARQVALDMACLASEVMQGEIPEDLQEVFDQWEKEEAKHAKSRR